MFQYFDLLDVEMFGDCYFRDSIRIAKLAKICTGYIPGNYDFVPVNTNESLTECLNILLILTSHISFVSG